MSLLVEERHSDSATPEAAGAVIDFRTLKPLRTPEPGAWSVTGQPLRDADLRRRIQAALGEEADGDERDFATLGAALDAAHEALLGRLVAGDGDREALAATLREADDLRAELVRTRAAQLQSRFSEVRAALGRLRSVTTIPQLLERAGLELCRCGFDRAILSRVSDSMWEVEHVHVEGDAEWAAEIKRVANLYPQRIDHLLVESEMMRRRAPLLVDEVTDDGRTNGPISMASLSRSYVTAPIMPEGRIIGFFHADGYMGRRHVDQDDLSVLWMFAEGFGSIFHRTALQERLRQAREQVQALTRSMAASMDAVCGGELALEPPAPAAAPAGMPALAGATAASLIAPQSRLESLLSRREIEVLSLMAQGKSNGEIATHLVISEGTVKSHVKHILRKLRAANRAEAVFRFMRLTALQGTT